MSGFSPDFFFFIACGGTQPGRYFLLVQKVSKKDTTPKDTAILLSHRANHTNCYAKFCVRAGRGLSTHFLKRFLYTSFITNMKLLLTILLLSSFICFTKAQLPPPAQVLVNAYRCRSEACVDKALNAVNYVRSKPDKVDKYRTIFIYKPKVGGEDVIYVNSDNYFVQYTTSRKVSSDTLVKDFKDLGFEQESFRSNINLKEQMADILGFLMPGDYTIFLGVISYKKMGEYSFSLSVPR